MFLTSDGTAFQSLTTLSVKKFLLGSKVPFLLKTFEGIVSRDFVVCFLVSFDRSEVPTHKERILLLLKFNFVSGSIFPGSGAVLLDFTQLLLV
jgi:hypothetical protein